MSEREAWDVMADERAFQIDNGMDTMTVAVRDHTVNFEIDGPMAGSTETGFGATCRFHMSRDRAKQFAAWLTKVTA